MENNIKAKGLFVIDIDGTFADDRKGIPDINIKACNKLYEEFGIIPVIATARPLEVAKFITNKCGPAFQHYIISTNGALLTDLKTGEHLVNKTLSPETTSKLVDICTRNNLEWEFMTTKEEVAMEQYREQRCDDPMYKRMGKEFNYQNDLNGFLNGIHDQNIPVPLFAISGSEEQLNSIQDELQTIAGLSVSDLCHRTTTKGETVYYVDIMADGATKLSAIEELAKTLGISQKAVIAIGDGGNDKEMIEKAGLGVAMKNAKPALKDIAGKVTHQDNNHGGLGYFAVQMLRHLRMRRREKEEANRLRGITKPKTTETATADTKMLGRRREAQCRRQGLVKKLGIREELDREEL